MADPSILENELCRFTPQGVYTEEGSKTIRRVKVPYFYLTLADIKMCYAGTAFLNPNEDGTIVRWLPYKDPDDPTQYVLRVDPMGFGYDGDPGRLPASDPEVPFVTGMTPKYWNTTIHLGHVPYDLGDIYDVVSDAIIGATPTGPRGETQRFCTKTVRENRELLTPPLGSVWREKAGGGRTQLQIPAPTLLPLADIEVIWWHVPLGAYPRQAIDDCAGTVNSAALYLPTRPDGLGGEDTAYSHGTMQFLGARPDEIRFGDGTFGYNIHYFWQRLGDDYGTDGGIGINWNSLPDELNVWRKVYRSELGTELLYPEADHNRLFISGAIEP